jgi:hypothetical protein
MTPLLQSPTAEPSAPREEPRLRLRASDADRTAVVRTLLDAITRGLLTFPEADERVAAAYAARFLDELGPLTADLPPAPASAPVAPGWRALALLAWLQLRTAVATLARATRRAVRGRPRLVVAMLAALVLLALIAASGVGGAEGSGHGHDGSYSWDDDRHDDDRHDDDRHDHDHGD